MVNRKQLILFANKQNQEADDSVVHLLMRTVHHIGLPSEEICFIEPFIFDETSHFICITKYFNKSRCSRRCSVSIKEYRNKYTLTVGVSIQARKRERKRGRELHKKIVFLYINDKEILQLLNLIAIHFDREVTFVLPSPFSWCMTTSMMKLQEVPMNQPVTRHNRMFILIANIHSIANI